MYGRVFIISKPVNGKGKHTLKQSNTFTSFVFTYTTILNFKCHKFMYCLAHEPVDINHTNWYSITKNYRFTSENNVSGNLNLIFEIRYTSTIIV